MKSYPRQRQDTIGADTTLRQYKKRKQVAGNVDSRCNEIHVGRIGQMARLARNQGKRKSAEDETNDIPLKDEYDDNVS
jgi:hypothetical protein